MKYKLSVNTLFALFCSLNNFFSWGFVCLFRFIIMFDRVINSAAETSKKIPPPQKKKINITLLFVFDFFKMIFTAFSENFLPENKLAADFSQTFTLTAFSWPLANFSWFSSGQEKSHFFYNHMYNYLYYRFSLIMSVHDNTVIDTFWLCWDCPRCLK